MRFLPLSFPFSISHPSTSLLPTTSSSTWLLPSLSHYPLNPALLFSIPPLPTFLFPFWYHSSTSLLSSLPPFLCSPLLVFLLNSLYIHSAYFFPSFLSPYKFLLSFTYSPPPHASLPPSIYTLLLLPFSLIIPSLPNLSPLFPPHPHSFLFLSYSTCLPLSLSPTYLPPSLSPTFFHYPSPSLSTVRN